jgi:hypothetical protein
VLLPQQMLSDTGLTFSLILDMRCLGSHLGHVVDKVYYTLAVTPLIVIPGHQLHTGQSVGSSSDTAEARYQILQFCTCNIVCNAQIEVGAKTVVCDTNCWAKDSGTMHAAFRHLQLLAVRTK